MGNYLRASVIGLALALCAPAMAAAQDETRPTSATLDTVVVTATRTEEKLREVTTNVTIIDEQTIQRSPGSTLDSILKREGIQILEYPGQGTATVAIRGVLNDLPALSGGLGLRNMLLIDGRPAGTGNVAAVTKTNIERIEIIRGPAGIAYGSQAAGGVINVITKRGAGDLSGHARAGFGSWSYNDQEAGIDGRAGAFDYSLGLFHSSMDNYTTGGGIKAEGADNKGTYSGSANLGYNFLDDLHRIGLTSRFFRNQLQGTGNWFSTWNPDENIKLENESFDLNYAGKSEDGPLSWQLKYFHAGDKYFVYADRARTVNENETKVDLDGVQGQLTADFGLLALTGGLDWQKQDISSYSSYSSLTPQSSDMYNTGAYLLGKLRLLDDNLIFTGGLRYDTFEHSATGNKKKIDNWSPTFGAAYLPLEWLKLRTNVSKGFRTPTPLELVLDMDMTSQGGGRTIGNPDLDPEYNTSYEVGFDVNYGSSLTFGLTYFNTDYKNRISQDFSGYPDTTYLNADREVTAAGLEMNASFDFGSYLDWPLRFEPYVKTTYYTKREGTTQLGDYGYGIRRVPKSITAFGLDLDYPDWGLFANLNATHVGKRIENQYPIGYFELPSYTLVDLTVEKVLAEFADKHKLSAKFAAQNMFDKDYVVVPEYPTPGASVYFGLKYEFN